MSSRQDLLEQYIAGLSVRVDDIGSCLLNKDWLVPEHVPGFSRLWYIKSGYGFLYINGKAYLPTAGQMALIPAHATVSFGSLPDRQPFYQCWADFDARIGDQRLFDLIPLPPLVQVQEQKVLPQFEKLAALRDVHGPAAALRRKSLIYELIARYIIAVGEDDVSVSPIDLPLQQVLQYIDEHLTQKISNAELAALLHYSPGYFIKYFRRYMHCTPVEYINTTRIQRAKELLLSTDMSILQIALSLSFSGESYFSRTFFHHTGCTPTNFRKTHTEKRRFDANAQQN